jgi:hypothetical protein
MTDGKSSCCAQGRTGNRTPEIAVAITPSATPIARRWSSDISGTFVMGSDDRRFPEDGEGPPRRVRLSPFAIACHAVSNLQFGDFVRATGSCF